MFDWLAALQAALWALHWLRWQSWLQYLAVLHRPHLRVPGSEQVGLEQGSAMLGFRMVFNGGCGDGILGQGSSEAVALGQTLLFVWVGLTDSDRVLKSNQSGVQEIVESLWVLGTLRKRTCHSYNTTNMQMESKIETL